MRSTDLELSREEVLQIMKQRLDLAYRAGFKAGVARAANRVRERALELKSDEAYEIAGELSLGLTP